MKRSVLRASHVHTPSYSWGGRQMPYVACPSCGERGKIPPSLLGSRVKCKKCGLSFNVAPAAAKATASAGPTAVGVAAATIGSASEGIAVESLEASAWTVPDDHGRG